MDSREWKAALDGNAARLVFVNTTSSSFQFVPALSGKNRIVIAATDSAAQKYATVFPQYFIEALERGREGRQRQERPAVGVGGVRLCQPGGEAGVRAEGHARHRAIDHRRQRRRRRARKRRPATGTDGVLAKTTFLDPLPASSVGQPGWPALEKRRIALEAEIEQLKARKGRDAGGAVRRRIRAPRHRAREDLRADSID